MSINSSSSNDSLFHPNHSSNNPDTPHYMDSSFTRPHTFIFSAYCITNILLLVPLSILVFYMGLQRRWQQHSNSSSATSHSDVFTYHMVTMELFNVLGCIISCWGVFKDRIDIFDVGLYFWIYVWNGELLFHILTCVERYLAVVHPITYLSPDMSVNSSSSSSNDSLLLYPEIHCFITKSASFIFTTYCITNVLLLLPLSILVFYVGLQRWRQQRSNSSTATNHSDSFTYHMVMVELIGVLGCIVSCCGIYRNRVTIVFIGFCLWSFTWYGQMSFHVLTCVERYLAVVHPITYMSLLSITKQVIIRTTSSRPY